MIHLAAAPAAATRLEDARRFLSGYPSDRERLIVAASRGAADDLGRAVTGAAGAAFGLHRFGVWQFVAKLAAGTLAREGLAPATALGTEALAARAIHDLAAGGRAGALAPVLRTPGFARAAASTLAELRLAGVKPQALDGQGPAANDLAALVTRFAAELTAAKLADRSVYLEFATAALASGAQLGRLPTVVLDVRVTTRAAAAFWTEVARTAPDLLVTVPAGDDRTLDFWRRLGGRPRPETLPPPTALERIRRHVFAEEAPPQGAPDDSIELFSAPGEARECVEIVRRLLEEARRGTRFDEMAVLLRAPQSYWSVLEHALRRGDVPAHFSQGTRRPDPSGRAFLAVLACAAEDLSAARFAEYLSLGQIPRLSPDGVPEASPARWQSSADDLTARADPQPLTGQLRLAWDAPDQAEAVRSRSALPGDLAGTLRTPRKWEALLVESAVIGGAARWARRLDGLAAELEVQLQAVRQDDADSAAGARLARDLEHLGHLRRFALPLIERLAALPPAARWGEWLEHLEALAHVVLKRPERVLAVLAELRPMASVGPVTLEDVRSTLTPRLTTVAEEPVGERYGRVFIGTPEQALGRAFRVVFVPGLAERMFPQPLREDPLLLDGTRWAVDAEALPRQDERAREERLWLHVAIGAARERLYLSYPRLQLEQARPRVPSFYALDVMRAVRGVVPGHDAFARDAAERGEAWLAWPAPRDPDSAIDDFEHDLSTLGPLLHASGAPGGRAGGDPDARGRARYLVDLNSHLARALRARFARWNTRWSRHDGLACVSEATRALLDRHRPTTRPYSVSALQRFAACPYRFLLGSIYRLEPFEPPRAIERLDPLTRGALFHEVQRELLRALAAAGLLPVTEASVGGARLLLDEVFARVAGEYRERLAPAIDRVWRDELDAIRTDLRIWLEELVHDGREWTPAYFELSFGLPPDAAHDPRSAPDAVRLDGRFHLRGSIDLVEEHRETGHLRVTDHKTGRNWTTRNLIVGGGETLQPVLYSLAAEQTLGRPVITSRLSFCTTAGGFSVHEIPLVGPRAREAGLRVIDSIDRAVAGGNLPAAPRRDACRWCDFRAVCGPVEEERTRRKQGDLVDELLSLRAIP